MGSFSKPRGQREEELIAMSGSLTLMTNLCLAWTTSKIQSVMQTSSFGNDTTWLKAVSPAHFRNINLKGTFAFPVDQYRERRVWRRCDRGASVKHQWSAECVFRADVTGDFTKA